jgi:hypothetical protein
MAGKQPFKNSHQTARLGPGRHRDPGEVVCVMELASMLAGERFSDRPSTVCPIVGAVLRAYNDDIDDQRRQDLYRYAADSLGTRGDFLLQRRRAQAALDWAREAGHRKDERGPQARLKRTEDLDADSGPDRIARHVVKSLRRRRTRRQAVAKRWSDESHAEMMELLDHLIATGNRSAVESLIGEFVEDRAEPVDPPAHAVDLPTEPTDLPADLADLPAEPADLPAEPADLPAQPVDLPAGPSKAGHRTRDRSAEVLGGIILVGAAVVFGRACRAVAA